MSSSEIPTAYVPRTFPTTMFRRKFSTTMFRREFPKDVCRRKRNIFLMTNVVGYISDKFSMNILPTKCVVGFASEYQASVSPEFRRSLRRISDELFFSDESFPTISFVGISSGFS